ncbi:Interferon-induced GTP-binding protein Mx1 [Cyphellophora attinorum]|uniref:Interferon-induced GTP-binding protein Mx1 n=1 Tax=Cyphellophora attinorum TaxID=1664694 RepID=A0A0N1H5T6_9EURO|nr:Interferon-induced GTP-binding protein Mx1 [Phialophora attinorum]KPI37234.1 Interferon-induced GTP-binding protein Mx1 [Phialophora attinorum]
MSAIQSTVASVEHKQLLDTIDKCRSQGVARWIDLPQIIVCGDQSSGKSSCLEAICGLKFPTGDGLCTRFPTEYILRRSPDSGVTISIVPCAEGPEADKTGLEKFKASTDDLNQFPQIVQEAAKAMGIDNDVKKFSNDVLRIEVMGPKQDNLTLVDLPGLFHSASRTQSEGDKKNVRRLVAPYIKRPRSIILAVVSAKNDISNQYVLDFARKYDSKGARTLGIITKPDTLPASSPSEQAYLDLAENRDVKFALGWHVLRNRSYEDNKLQTSFEERDLTEQIFFSEGAWAHVNEKKKGVQSLKIRLSGILCDHIASELPDLLDETERGLKSCNARLKALGVPRGTNDEQRMYLLKASQRYVALLSAAVDGVYSDPYFGSSLSEEGYDKRLCAKTMSLLKEFAEFMRANGHAIQLVDKLPPKYSPRPGPPRKMEREEYYDQVQMRMRRNGGKELPGLYSPSIVADLFYDQAASWPSLVEQVRTRLVMHARTAIMYVLEDCLDEATVDGVCHEFIDSGMNQLENDLRTKTDEVLRPHTGKEVLTLDRSFIKNIMAKREEKARKDISQRLLEFLRVDPNGSMEDRLYRGEFDALQLLDVLVRQSEPDTERFAAVDCVNAMESYYTVALKALIDNFSLYAVKACFLDKVQDLFTPDKVLKLSNKEVQHIAGESDETLDERAMLTEKLAALEETRLALVGIEGRRSRAKSVKRKHSELEGEEA